ncbi:hypothetical protein B0H16DRAFT_162073 [Mycena metata]|uniref:Uncharacterized protein n=1 Tax=Mycena metata TaxID=1033252 RepID=A0AAD7I2T0_9AGAR|nr:hypothetical protein B0H16DRAFT_162073 [Mycena metata]
MMLALSGIRHPRLFSRAGLHLRGGLRWGSSLRSCLRGTRRGSSGGGGCGGGTWCICVRRSWCVCVGRWRWRMKGNLVAKRGRPMGRRAPSPSTRLLCLCVLRLQLATTDSRPLFSLSLGADTGNAAREVGHRVTFLSRFSWRGVAVLCRPRSSTASQGSVSLPSTYILHWHLSSLPPPSPAYRHLNLIHPHGILAHLDSSFDDRQRRRRCPPVTATGRERLGGASCVYPFRIRVCFRLGLLRVPSGWCGVYPTGSWFYRACGRRSLLRESRWRRRGGDSGDGAADAACAQ